MKSSIIARFLAALFIVSGLSAVLRAQAADAITDKKEEAVQLATLVVTTGSNIPTAADATDVPISVIGSQDIQQTGLNANLLEILRKRIPAFAGRSNAGNSNATNTNQFTAGGSQIALRNLTTLVLINGRRIATSGANAAGGKSFVDINQIPAAAIDRMEILTDGASAIYGSDAVGGVVNIILKSNYQGAEMGGRYAVASDAGHYTERSGYVVAGAAADGVNVTVTGSWSKTDPMWQYQRSFISPNLKSGTNFPGFVSGDYLKPGLNSPSLANPVGVNATAVSLAGLEANGTYLPAGSSLIPAFNAAPYVTMLLQQEQKSALANLSAELAGRKLVAFGDFMYSKTKSFAQTAGFLGNLAAVTVPAGAPYNPVIGAVAGVVVGSVNNPLRTFNDSTGTRGTIGFRGEINRDWSWEVGATYSQDKTNQRLQNALFAPNLNLAMAGGFDATGNAVVGGGFSKVFDQNLYPGATPGILQPALDPFARAGVNPASIANVYGTELIQTSSKLTSYDAKIVGAAFDLPAGKIAFAAGVATRKETLIGTPDRNSTNANSNWGGGLTFDSFDRSRTINSIFGEVRIPITSPTWTLPGIHALDVSVAGRSEKYSDFGRSNVPKVGLRWQPADEQLTVRFTYSKAFEAPLLVDEFGAPNGGFVSGNSFLYNSILTPAGTKDPALLGLQYFSGNGNNPNLQPDTAVSRSLGVVYSPKAVKGLTVSLDYVQVRESGFPAGQDDLLASGGILADVNLYGSASPAFSQASVGGLPGTSGATNAQFATPGGIYRLLTSGTYQGNLYFLDHKVNSGGMREKALDVTVDYELPTEAMGKFDFNLTGTYLMSFQSASAPDAPFNDFAGYATNGSLMSGTFPKFSSYASVDWTHHDWEITVGNSYKSSVTDIQSGKIPAAYLQSHPATTVSSYAAWDLQLAYTFSQKSAAGNWSWLRGLRVAVGVNNVFDRMPPTSPLAQAASLNNDNADIATYSPIGRLIFVSAKLKF